MTDTSTAYAAAMSDTGSSADAGSSGGAPDAARNVLGGELDPCSFAPLTGFFRDGCCQTGPDDIGVHSVCAQVTEEFLEFSRAQGNDLSTPAPAFGFAGLVPGDRWCVVAVRWAQALADGVAAPVVLAATHESALDIVPLAELRKFAVDVPPDLSSLR